MDKCLDGGMAAVPPYIYGCAAVAGVCCSCLAYLAVERNRSPLPRSWTAFGVGAHAIMAFLCGMALMLCVPAGIMFFVIRAAPGDQSEEMACRLQSSMFGYPILSFFLTLILLLLLLFNGLRLRVRHAFAAIARPHLAPVSAIGVTAAADAAWPTAPRCVVLPAYRGVFVAPVARAFLDNCAEAAKRAARLAHASGGSAGGGSAAAAGVPAGAAVPSSPLALLPEIYALDAYSTLLCPEDDAWIKHNVHHDMGGIAAGARVGFTTFLRLPFSSGSVDTLVIPLGKMIAFLTQRTDSADRQHAKAVWLLTGEKQRGVVCMRVQCSRCKRADHEAAGLLPGLFDACTRALARSLANSTRCPLHVLRPPPFAEVMRVLKPGGTLVSMASVLDGGGYGRAGGERCVRAAAAGLASLVVACCCCCCFLFPIAGSCARWCVRGNGTIEFARAVPCMQAHGVAANARRHGLCS